MIKNIVFPGGGFKCWAYIGTIRALSEHKTPDLEQIIGVSAGGFFGLLYILGIKWDFLLDFFMNLNFKELFDVDIDNVLVQQSLFAGIKFTGIIRELVSLKVDPDITFKELRCYSKIKFTVNALNISDSKLDYFNYELTPDVKVIDAIRASSCLPLIFPPYSINGKLYYDGGLSNNCPIDTTEEVFSIAFDISCDSEKYSINIINLLNTLSIIANKGKEKNNVYSILNESFKDQAVNLKQTRDDIFNIYMYGYINSKNIIFENYVALK
jgi:predicted acylesterase/phospholipase RssA